MPVAHAGRLAKLQYTCVERAQQVTCPRQHWCRLRLAHLQQELFAAGDGVAGEAEALQGDADGRPVLRARPRAAWRGRQPRRQQPQRASPQLLTPQQSHSVSLHASESITKHCVFHMAGMMSQHSHSVSQPEAFRADSMSGL